MINIKMKGGDPSNCKITNQDGQPIHGVTDIQIGITAKRQPVAIMTVEVADIDITGIDADVFLKGVKVRSNLFKPGAKRAPIAKEITKGVETHQYTPMFDTPSFGNFHCTCKVEKEDLCIEVTSQSTNKQQVVFGTHFRIAGSPKYRKVKRVSFSRNIDGVIPAYMIQTDEPIGESFPRGQVVGFYEKS